MLNNIFSNRFRFDSRLNLNVCFDYINLLKFKNLRRNLTCNQSLFIDSKVFLCHF